MSASSEIEAECICMNKTCSLDMGWQSACAYAALFKKYLKKDYVSYVEV